MSNLEQRQLQRLRKAMDLREKELRAQIAEGRERASTEGLSQLEGIASDEADRAFAEIRVGIESELVDRYLNELKAIEAARARIDNGTFGLCVDCDGVIDYGRLSAHPAACRCADCQALHEKTFAHKPIY